VGEAPPSGPIYRMVQTTWWKGERELRERGLVFVKGIRIQKDT